MRIISGIWGGRTLRAPDDERIRPTADRVREAMFNTLYSLSAADDRWSLEGATVLDLFAGTGAIGLEALSRGAASVVFVESDRAARRLIAENVASLGAEDAATIVAEDVLTFLGRSGELSGGFDLVFADPPYAFDAWPQLLELLPADRLVAEAGVSLEAHGAWRDIASRSYGTTVLTFFDRLGPDDEGD